MIENHLNRALFQNPTIGVGELTRRLDEMMQQLWRTVEAISAEVTSLESQIDTLAASGNYTGIIYAIDSGNRTVELKVVNGKLITGTRV